MPDDEDLRAGLSGALPVVPDDISSLAADIAAYHREVRLQRRRRRWRRWTGSPLARRAALPVLLAAGTLALSAAVAAMLSFTGTGGRSAAVSAAPLAHPTAAVGDVGGLLPDVTLRETSGGHVAARDVRPALVALVPLQCRCTTLLDGLAGQAFSVHVGFAVVAPGGIDAEVSALAGQLRRGSVEGLFDPSGALARTYASTGVTAVLVGRDGTVVRIADPVTANTTFAADLQRLALSRANH